VEKVFLIAFIFIFMHMITIPDALCNIVTLDFVDETPSLEGLHANPATPESADASSRPSARPTGRGINSPKTRENSYETSRNDSEAWTTTPSGVLAQISSPVAKRGLDSGVDEVETAESLPSENSNTVPSDNEHYERLATHATVPEENSIHWIPQPFDLPSVNTPESAAPFPQPLAESINPQDSDYWPYMTVQEAYLMRYFIDKLACWVSLSPKHTYYELTSSVQV
jgi:hypothetical protein